MSAPSFFRHTKRIRRHLFAFEEDKHERDSSGKFKPKGGGDGGSSEVKEDGDGTKAASEDMTGPGAAVASDEFRSSLSDSERGALEWYTGDGWTEVNSALRGTPDIRTGRVRDVSEVSDAISNLDSAIEKAGKADPPFRVYRGISVGDPEGFVRGIAERGEFSDPSYQSTSTEPGVAASSGNVVFVMRTSNAAPLGGISVNSKAESEVLVARGQSFRPTGEPKRIIQGGKTLWVIGMEEGQGG